MNRLIITLQIAILIVLSAVQSEAKERKIDLSGKWTYRLDPKSEGDVQKWFTQSFTETLILPGSLTTNGIGDEVGLNTPWTGSIIDSSWYNSPTYEKYRQPGNIKIPFWLQPVKYYKGQAWYQREITIPESWGTAPAEIFLERCHWESRVWVDGQPVGMQNSLATPHRYSLGILSPGKHTLTICMDNRIKDINPGINAHSISDHTQSNWNGIVGRMELSQTMPLQIRSMQLYPDISKKTVKLKLVVNNSGRAASSGSLSLQVTPENFKAKAGSKLNQSITLSPGDNALELTYPMGSNVKLWDEFSPNVYKMNAKIVSDKLTASRSEQFGMREVSTKGTRITVNGKERFIRGTLECAIFPKTGYPPTDRESWARIFRIARGYGLNLLRFHSWCPPAAAFEAADLAGFYLQVECDAWATIGDGKPIDRYVYDEGDRILETYGNHPSFCLMLYGNEPGGANQAKWLGGLVSSWKAKDSRRLYSSAAGWPAIKESDFHNLPEPRIQGWGEGLKSILNSGTPNTNYDWRERIAQFDKPVVSHEIGQWCVYPDLKEIKQYTGVLKARNFEIFSEQLAENGMSQLADSFLLASGKLQVLCYKADIEAALRTPGFGGFELLDLHDFPGQGTALVGVLNPFWEEKGYVTAKEYRRFCNNVVPLVRLSKMIYSGGETLNIPVEVAQFGASTMENATPKWTLTGMNKVQLASGTLAKRSIPIGNAIPLGEIQYTVPNIEHAQQVELTVRIGDYENSWHLWFYPKNKKSSGTAVYITQTLDDKALSILKEGGKVLMTPKKGSIAADKGGSVMVGFSSIFWNTAWTHRQPPHTLGILCNPSHPALAEFPTEYHSDYQWQDAMSHCNAILLPALSPNIKPIVRIIDDWFTNRPLGLIVEAKVGKGKLLLCGADLLSDAENRPAARQLLYSLEQYMDKPQFNPTAEVSEETLKALFSR